jgi:hypothetical protein
MNLSKCFKVAVVVSAVLLGHSVMATGQELLPGPVQNGPLVVTPISKSIVFSPDAKITTVNGETSVLAGGYVGKLTDRTLLIGAGAYWLAGPRDDTSMFYGGLVLGGRVAGTDRVSVNIRGLAGVGWGSVTSTFLLKDPRHHFGRFDRPSAPTTVRGEFSQSFLIVEPEASVAFGITRGMNLNVGVGYRALNGDLSDLLRGVTGSVGVQFNLK